MVSVDLYVGQEKKKLGRPWNGIQEDATEAYYYILYRLYSKWKHTASTAIVSQLSEYWAWSSPKRVKNRLLSDIFEFRNNDTTALVGDKKWESTKLGDGVISRPAFLSVEPENPDKYKLETDNDRWFVYFRYIKFSPDQDNTRSRVTCQTLWLSESCIFKKKSIPDDPSIFLLNLL